jgi:hypothetical protein
MAANVLAAGRHSMSLCILSLLNALISAAAWEALITVLSKTDLLQLLSNRLLTYPGFGNSSLF